MKCNLWREGFLLKLSFTSCIQKHPQEKRNTKDTEGGKKTRKHTRTLKPILAGGSPDAPPNLQWDGAMKFTAPICVIITVSIFFLQEKYTTKTTIQPHPKTLSFTMTSSFPSSNKEAQTFSWMQNLLKKNLYTSWRDWQVGILLCGCRNRHKKIFSLFFHPKFRLFRDHNIGTSCALFFATDLFRWKISSGRQTLADTRKQQRRIWEKGWW